MADIEKVIKGLETCIPMKYETDEEKECRHEQCPYGRENYKPTNGCFWDLMADALELLFELLKEHQPKKPHYTMLKYNVSGKVCSIKHPECPKCFENGLHLWDAEIEKGQAFCKRCGQAIDWSEDSKQE